MPINAALCFTELTVEYSVSFGYVCHIFCTMQKPNSNIGITLKILTFSFSTCFKVLQFLATFSAILTGIAQIPNNASRVGIMTHVREQF